jgi:hypothetical protein
VQTEEAPQQEGGLKEKALQAEELLRAPLQEASRQEEVLKEGPQCTP